MTTFKTILAAAALCAGVAVQAQTISVTPAPGEVTELSTFAITIDAEWTLGSHRSAKFVVTGPEGVEIPKIQSWSEQTYYAVAFADDAVITTPGHYTLTIPAGKFAVKEQDLPETVFEYDIVAGAEQTTMPAYTIDPAEGVYKTLSGGFTLTFDTDQEISVDPTGVTLFGGENIYSLTITVDNDAHTVHVLPSLGGSDLISLAADYNLIFPAKSIKVGDATNRRSLVFIYTVTGDVNWGWKGEYTATPRDGAEVESLQNIYISFAGAGVVRVSDSALPNEFPALYDRESGRQICGATAIGGSSTLNISLLQEVTEGGEYQLVVPRKFFKVDGHYPDADIILNYSIAKTTPDIDYTYTLTPAAGSQLGAAEAVTITFEAEGLADVEYDPFAWGTNAPHFTNADSAYNPTLRAVKDGNSYSFEHDWPFESAGTYTLVIPAAYFTLTTADGAKVKNAKIEADYTITLSSIQSVTAPAAKGGAYSINGIRLSDDAPLAPGFYIIDGKKTFIK